MLVEKTGIATFRIYDPNNDISFFIDNSEFLTPLQEKQMSFQKALEPLLRLFQMNDQRN